MHPLRWMDCNEPTLRTERSGNVTSFETHISASTRSTWAASPHHREPPELTEQWQSQHRGHRPHADTCTTPPARHDQADASSGAAARHRAPPLSLGRPARRTPGHSRRAHGSDGLQATLTRAARSRHPRHPVPGSRVPCQCRSPPACRVRQRRGLARHRLPGILAADRNRGTTPDGKPSVTRGRLPTPRRGRVPGPGSPHRPGPRGPSPGPPRPSARPRTALPCGPRRTGPD